MMQGRNVDLKAEHTHTHTHTHTHKKKKKKKKKKDHDKPAIQSQTGIITFEVEDPAVDRTQICYYESFLMLLFYNYTIRLTDRYG